jgi:signal transduction histidine kinase/ligand-binding sensor domain-containing protein
MFTQVKYPLLILLVASANYLPAQTNSSQYNFKQLNVQNGLSQNIVYQFLQDYKGYIWLGTHNGLTMYDGTRAVSFMHDEQKNNSLASNFITRILEDTNHQVWVGNEKGIDLFNRNNNTFSHYGVDRPGGEKDNTYCVPVGFGSPAELWFIDTKTKSIRAFNTKTKSSQFICEMNEVDGVIYIDSSTHLVHFWSYQSIGTIHLVFKGHTLLKTQIFFSNSNNFFHHPLQIVHALQQNDSTTWLSTNEGLVCLNALNSTYKIYDRWNGSRIKESRYAALSPDGILWMGTGPSGVYTFDTKKREFINNYKNNRLDPFSICSNNIVAVYFDKSGNVWCGSYGGGASYTSIESNFFAKHFIDEKESANNILWTGLDNNENCWCIVEDQDGFWVFDKTFSKSKHLIPLADDGKAFACSMYKLVFTKSGNAWVVTNKGLYRYNVYTNKMHRVKYPLLSGANFGSNWMRDMFKLHDGSIIFSTFAGLYSIKEENGNARVTLFSQLNEIYDKSFTTLFQDEAGNIYIKGDDSLFILKQKANDGQPALIKSIAFPVDVYQYFSDATQNLVYIATNDGLYILDKKNYTLQKQNFEHMPFQSVNNVFEKDDKLWLFGEKGLYYFNKKSKQSRTFTIEDGLPGNEFNESSITVSADGKCMAGNAHGLVSFYPGKFLKNLYPPRAQLDHIYINDTLYASTNSANEINSISLTYRQNTFAFDFSAISFQHNSDCVYEYKLEGYDKDWIKSGATHFTRYSKISPGDYTFKLRVKDVNGVISPFMKDLQIKISKAFWQTTLFRIAFLIIVLCIGWLFIKWYLSTKIRKQKIIFEKQQAIDQERTRIAMEMHDDLGSGLTAIRYLAGSLSVQSSSAAKDKAIKIANSAQLLVDAMNDIIWTMKSDNNTLQELLAYIRKQTGEQLETAGIEFKFKLPANIPEIKLNSEQKRSLLLISKEAVHNIIKHSAATEVFATIEIRRNCFELKIADNGKGIDAGKTSQFGNGLKSMKRRAEEIDAQLNILNSSGTTIILTLSFG